MLMTRRNSIMNDNKNLDERKLNLIKLKVITIEKDNVIKKDPSNKLIEDIRKYIDKVVDGKC